MRITAEAGSAEAPAIEQRGMIELVFEDVIVVVKQGGQYADIGHEAAAEQQRATAAGERCQLFFQRGMRLGVAGDQM